MSPKLQLYDLMLSIIRPTFQAISFTFPHDCTLIPQNQPAQKKCINSLKTPRHPLSGIIAL